MHALGDTYNRLHSGHHESSASETFLFASQSVQDRHSTAHRMEPSEQVIALEMTTLHNVFQLHAHLLDVEGLHGLLIAGVHGEEEQVVLPEAGCQGSEQPRGLLLVSEQHQFGLTHRAAKGAVQVAAADAGHDVWEG